MASDGFYAHNSVNLIIYDIVTKAGNTEQYKSSLTNIPNIVGFETITSNGCQTLCGVHPTPIIGKTDRDQNWTSKRQLRN